jgi:hypothetical protein
MFKVIQLSRLLINTGELARGFLELVRQNSDVTLNAVIQDPTSTPVGNVSPIVEKPTAMAEGLKFDPPTLSDGEDIGFDFPEFLNLI